MFGKQKQMGRWITIAVAMGLVCASHVSAQKPPKPPQDEPLTYKMVQLSSDRGPANAINELADGVVEVVGTIQDSSGESEISRAHYWMVDRAGDVLPINLKTLPPEEPEATVHSDALDVNNHGVVVGSQRDETSHYRPLLWPSGADAPIALPLPDGAVGATPTSINDEGIVVGMAWIMDVRKLVAWKVALVDGVWIVQDPLVIPSEPGLSVWHLPQIVNSGYVGLTLYSAGVDGSQRAFRLKLGWDDTGMLLGVLEPMTPLFDCFSTAYGINEAGTICGRYSPSGEWGEAYVMTVSGALLDLPVIPAMKKTGIDYSATHNLDAMGLNNLDAVQIVGWGSRRITQGNYQGSEFVPLRWDGETRVTDLRTVYGASPAYLYKANNINDAGWITASTRNQAWESFPVLLIPSK